MVVTGDNVVDDGLDCGGKHMVVLRVIGDDVEPQAAWRDLGKFPQHSKVMLDVCFADRVLLENVWTMKHIGQLDQGRRGH